MHVVNMRHIDFNQQMLVTREVFFSGFFISNIFLGKAYFCKKNNA